MTSRIWNGTDGAYETATNWSPVGVPTVGDTAIINDGSATASSPVANGLVIHVNAATGDGDALLLNGASLPFTSHIAATSTGAAVAAIQVSGALQNGGGIKYTGTSSGAPLLLLADGPGGSPTQFNNTGGISLVGE